MKRFLTHRARHLIVACVAAYALAIAALCLAGLRDDVGRADVALVLGNTVNPDGTLSPRLEGRMAEALRRYREGWFGLMVVSGGVGEEGRDEAAAMRDYLVANGVPADVVIADNLGADTYSSVLNVRAILRARNLHSVFVVTQYFHVPRTRLALHRAGIGTVYASHARYFEWRDFFSVQRDLVAWMWYAVRPGLRRDPP